MCMYHFYGNIEIQAKTMCVRHFSLAKQAIVAELKLQTSALHRWDAFEGTH